MTLIPFDSDLLSMEMNDAFKVGLLLFMILSLCVCVCVCVCLREDLRVLSVNNKMRFSILT